MKGDTYYLVLLSMFLIGEYFRVKYGINEKINSVCWFDFICNLWFLLCGF